MASWIGDRFSQDKKTIEDIAPGSGGVIRYNGEQLAVHREDDGTLKACSAVCTHMGGIVHWNDADKSWDCPCHGARFYADGEVLTGPAILPLPPRSVEPDFIVPSQTHVNIGDRV